MSPAGTDGRRYPVRCADGVRLSVVEAGPPDAPSVVFVHGTGMRALSWRHVCASLSADYRCVAFDLRGHGASEWSPTGDYSLQVHASDLGGVAAGSPQVAAGSPHVVVGMSLGAAVALAYAGGRPAGLTGLVLVDAGPMRSREAGRRRLDDEVFGAPSGRRWDRRARWWSESEHVAADELERRITDRRRLLWAATRDVEVPTLVVRGADSDLFAPEDARTTVAALADARLVVIPSAGHFVHRDQPADLARAVRAFLKSGVRTGNG